MTVLLLAGLVQASEVDAVDVPVPSADEKSSKNKSSSSDADGTKKKSGTKTKSEDDGEFSKGKIGKWTYQPYVTPGGGLTISEDGSSVAAGADVGIKYWRKKWKGDLSLGGSYLTGDGLNGYDVHAGNEFGRREKYWGVSAGLLGFYNGYAAAEGSGSTEELPNSLGLDIPLELVVGPKQFYGYGNYTPSFLSNEARSAPNIPFGDELEWGVGVGVALDWVSAELGYSQRTTAIGTVSTPTVTVQFSGWGG